jgi:hypothetical protein
MIILPGACDYRRGMAWITGFIDTTRTHAPLGTICDYSATANLHNSQFNIAPAKPFQACCIFTSRSLATASNGGDFPASRALVVPLLPASCSLNWTGSSSLLNYSATANFGESVNYLRLPILSSQLAWDPRYISSARTQQKTPFLSNPSIVPCVFVSEGTCLLSRCLVTDVCWFFYFIVRLYSSKYNKHYRNLGHDAV